MLNTSQAKIKRIIRRVTWNLTIPNLLLRVLPYHPGVKVQLWWFSKHWVQQLFFPQKIKLITDILCLLDANTLDQESIFLCSLMSNAWKNWRRAAFRKLDHSQWSIVKGNGNLSHAFAEGKGVILVTTHTFRTNLLTTLVSSLSHNKIFFVHKFYDSQDRTLMISAYARQLADALKILKSGGILGIAGDGTMGEGGFPIPFYGKMLTFRSGYADMSVRTGAPVLPVYEYLQSDGKVVLEIGPRITASGEKRENQVESIVRQYAQSLKEHWPTLVPSLSWFKLKQFIDEPDFLSTTQEG